MGKGVFPWSDSMHDPSPASLIRRPSHPLRFALLLGLASLLFAGAARADEVILKSGKVRRGDVISEDERFVVLESRLGRIRIPASEVAEVRRGEGEADEPATDDPSGETPPAPEPEPDETNGSHETPDYSGSSETGDAEPTSVVGDVEPDTGPSDRVRRARAARVVRRTTAPERDVATTATDTPKKTTIGGRVLGKVPAGTQVIVFQPPRPFEPAPGAIEIGKRTLATMEMAGRTSAWLTTAGAEGDQRIAIRLADVKRHVEVRTPEARMRLFEGINAGDWVRLLTTSGLPLQGRLDSLADGVVHLDTVDKKSGVSRTSLPLDDIVTVDGVIRDTAAELALSDIANGELLGVTFWPSGDHVMGRHVAGPSSVLSLDLDSDGKADRTILREGPLAEVRRIPARHRELAQLLHPGNVVRVTYRDDHPDAAIRRTTLGAIEALTAFAIAIRYESEAVIVPFDGVSELILIEDGPDVEIAKWHERIPLESAQEEMAVLPGMSVKEVELLSLDDGISTVSNGETITHVYVAAPFPSETLGIRIGEPVSQATRRSMLRFDTNIMPRIRTDAPTEPRQLISESIDGLRVVILADGLGVVTGIEISQAD